MQYIGSNIRFIFTKIKELLNSHNTDNSAHSELFKSWKRLRNPNNADIANALAATYKNGIGDVLVEVKDDTTFALEDIKLFFRPASFKLISANESYYEGIYITMDGTQGRYVAKTFADSEIMTPEGPTTISTPSELALYPAASDAVTYTPQTLTEEQKSQARTNIGALDVNVGTTPVDIGVGLGSTVYYVQSGWLRPCPDNADKELKLQYRRVFEFIGSQYLKPDSQNMLLQAKSAYALYQKGLASESIKATYNPLAATQVYVTWRINTISNKHYFYYAQVSTAYQYTCTYCVEDDALVTETYERPVYRTSNGVGEQDDVSQFRMSANPTEDMHIATKQYVDTAKTEAQQLGLTTATPGKTIKVKTVQDGKPTEWEAADIYEKPDTGIPKTDLEQSVQTSLAKADAAISYDSQTLTEEQKSQARTNIGAGQPVFVVNVTGTVDNNCTADKTATEIEAAYQAGRTIVCRWVVPFIVSGMPVELPLKSRVKERVFIFAVDQLVKKQIFTITVEISDSGVNPSVVSANIYEKPASGIPKSDLADDVQTSLAKADTAISYTPQTLTEEQQAQARTNIGALDVNVGTTPVDTNRTFFGVGKNIVYVKNGWLKPCPADADKELADNYANAVLGFGFINLDISVVKGEAKSAFSLYQQGLISDKGTILKNPLDVAQYITWTVGITNNKTYIDYRHVEHNGFYEYCRYFEDDTYSDLRASYSLSNYMSDSEPRGSVSQFRMSATPTEDMHVATKQYVDTAKTEAQQLGLTTATPGKTIKVKTVQNGKPTEWEVANIYEKPTSGIPKSDLEQSVQTSLAKADTSISYDSQTLTDAQKQQARQNIGAGQPDWNQNDSTQPDYVKNRPFYTGNPVETVLVEESTVSFSFSEDPSGYMAELTSTFEATVGETYKVYWDGAAYECTCVNVNNMPAIGNLSIVGGGSDTGEPFVMAVNNGQGITIVTADTSASHTFSISGFTQEVVKIDAKYLPNTVATKSEVEAAQNTANAAQNTAKNAQTTAKNAQTTAENAQTTANAAQTTANAAQTTAENALARTVEPYTRSIQMAPLYKNGGFSAWRGVVQEIGYNKTKGYFFADAFDTTALKEEDMPKDVFCVNVHVGSQSATAFLTKVVSGDGNDLWSVIGFAVITDGYYRTGEVLYVSSNAISRNETKGLFLTFRAPDSMLLKSSTANSTKQFRVTVDDSGVPTITDESDSTNTWKPTNLPTVTSSDSGKFLRVSDTGEWVAETVLSATVSNNTLIIRQCGGINNGGIYRY